MAGTTYSGGDVYEKIITEVRKHPALYDPGSKDYHDGPLKETLWLALSIRLNIDEEICRKKWRSLRDQFMKKRKKLKSVSGISASRIRNWKYMELMDFLSPHISERQPSSKSEQSTEGVEMHDPDPFPMVKVEVVASEDGGEDGVLGEEDVESELDMTSSPTSWYESTIPKTTAGSSVADDTCQLPGVRTFKRQRTGENSHENYTPRDLSRHQPHTTISRASAAGSVESNRTSIPWDEDEYFMLSCLPTLRRLSPYRKMELKCKIQQLLLEYTERDVPSGRAPSPPRGAAQSDPT